jgi:menaquinol-cytochrome c reductase iron-sulfur subunit
MSTSCCGGHGDHDKPPVEHAGPPTAEEINRRKFLALLSIVPGAVATVAIGVPVAGFIAGPLFVPQKPEWISIGPVSQFKVGETVQVNYRDPSPLPWAGVTANSAAYLRRLSETEFVAFAVNCSHLGCPVRWLPSAELFMCPCHGGVYYKDGSVAAGPPPHALSKYEIRIEDGQVQLQTREIPIG